jgi:hypothetical protein
MGLFFFFLGRLAEVNKKIKHGGVSKPATHSVMNGPQSLKCQLVFFCPSCPRKKKQQKSAAASWCFEVCRPYIINLYLALQCLFLCGVFTLHSQKKAI